TASVVVAADPADVGVFVSVDRTGGAATAVVEVAHDFFHFAQHVWDAATAPAPTVLAVPQDAHVDVHGDLVAVRTTTDWEVAGVRHPGGTLLVGPLAALLAGD